MVRRPTGTEIASVTTWPGSSGQAPLVVPARSSATNSNPNPVPAARPSHTPERLPGSGDAFSETRTMAGPARATPTASGTGRRSPSAIPTAAGIAVDSTPDSGATTLIRPTVSPRYRATVPRLFPRPLSAPHPSAAAVGDDGRYTAHTVMIARNANGCCATTTAPVDVLRPPMPPMKSEAP